MHRCMKSSIMDTWVDSSLYNSSQKLFIYKYYSPFLWVNEGDINYDSHTAHYPKKLHTTQMETERRQAAGLGPKQIKQKEW